MDINKQLKQRWKCTKLRYVVLYVRPSCIACIGVDHRIDISTDLSVSTHYNRLT